MSFLILTKLNKQYNIIEAYGLLITGLMYALGKKQFANLIRK